MHPEFTYIINALLEERTLELEASLCIANDSLSPTSRVKPFRSMRLLKPCSLGIIIYGPIDLSKDVGSFFEDYELYLQDPVGCKRNVRYCNPHRLPPLDGAVPKFTCDLGKSLQQLIEMDDIGARPDLLESLNSQEVLPETPQPPSIRTSLATYVPNQMYG